MIAKDYESKTGNEVSKNRIFHLRFTILSKTIPVATVTFKEERFPCMGIRRTKSDFSNRILLTPSPSLPMRIASSLSSGSLDQFSVPRSLVDTIQ